MEIKNVLTVGPLIFIISCLDENISVLTALHLFLCVFQKCILYIAYTTTIDSSVYGNTQESKKVVEEFDLNELDL